MSRLQQDVNLTEEEEMRRLEDGADTVPSLLGEARATYTPRPTVPGFDPGALGTLLFYSNRLEWTPDDASKKTLELDVKFLAAVKSSKAGSNAKLLIEPRQREGESKQQHVFDMTNEADLPGSLAARDQLRDTIEGILRANGSSSGGGGGGGRGGGGNGGGGGNSGGRGRPAGRGGSARGNGGGGSGGGSNAAGGSNPSAPSPVAGAKRPIPQPSDPPSSRAAKTSPSASEPKAAAAAAPKGTAGGSGGSGGSSAPVVPSGDGLSIGETEAAEEMMQSKPEVRKLYDELVVRAQALTPAEFWSQRRHLLYASSQQRGFSTRAPDEAERASAHEANVAAEREAAAAAAGGRLEGEGGGAQVKMRVTVAMKQRIFKDYPDVHRLFLELVPQQMAERVFWLRYFRSRTKQQNAAAGRAAAGAGGDEPGGDRAFSEATTRRKKVNATSQYPDTNLAAEEMASTSHGGGYGLAEPAAAVIGASNSELLREKPSERTERERREQEYNSHGRLVVDGISVIGRAAVGETRGEEVRRSWIELPDLREESNPAVLPLPAHLSQAGAQASADAAAAVAGASAGGGGGSSVKEEEMGGARQVESAECAAWIRETYVPRLLSTPLAMPDGAAVHAVVTGIAKPDTSWEERMKREAVARPMKLNAKLEQPLIEKQARGHTPPRPLSFLL